MLKATEIPPIVEQQIDWLARRLFKEKRASVLIGAGFSRNAVLHRTDQRPAPTWWEITKFLGERLNLPEKTINTRDGKDIAGQFEMTFGKDALAAAILEVVDNDSYSPSSLHTDLIRLPWTDIFTTNYDTLLEDAAKLITDRSYSLVANIPDITSSRAPRIVKLHGSFPSQRPFIITTEDFRTYPKKFAPFINLVQQSLMENTFVLLGFSGDDPNFKAWAGWVRDELGDYAPHILLVTTTKIDSTQRQYFETQGINVLDLGTVKFDRPLSELEKYHAPLEWFTEELQKRKGLNPKDFPAVYNPFQEKQISTNSEPDGYTPLDFGKLFDYHIDISNDDSSPLRERLLLWKEMRKRYAGWVICPSKQRKWLHQGIRLLSRDWNTWLSWLWNNPKMLIHNTNKSLELEILSEICWWFEMLLAGLPNSVLSDFIKTWKRNIENSHSLAWRDLGFNILRTARINLDQNLFNSTLSTLKSVTLNNNAWNSKIKLEELEFAISCLDHQSASIILKSWKPDFNNPFFETRRAAYLAQLGKIEEAISVASEALTEIRNRINRNFTDYGRLSEEGWTLNLLENLGKYQKFINKDTSIIETKERFEQLERDLCNPNPEITNTEGDIPFRIIPPSLKQSSGRNSFDPQVYTRSHSTRNNTEFDFIQAVAFLEMTVQGATPYKIGNVSIHKDAVTKSIVQLWRKSPIIATFHAIRCGDKNFIEEHFTRIGVLALPESNVSEIIELLLIALKKAIECTEKNVNQFEIEPGRHYDDVIFEYGTEILSRLTLRMSLEKRLHFLDLIIQVFKLPRVQTWMFLQTPLRNAFERTCATLQIKDIVPKIPYLLELPIPGEENFAQGQIATEYPEPFSAAFLYQESFNIDLGVDRSIVKKLLFLAESKNRETQRRAILRLSFLSEKHALNRLELELFGERIWNDTKQGHLPVFLNFYKTAYLKLPHPPQNNVLQTIKQHYIHSAVPKIRNPDNNYALGPDENSYFFKELTTLLHPDSSIEFSQKELTALLDNILSWWKDDGVTFVKDDSQWSKKDQIIRAIMVTVDFLIPKLLPLSKTNKLKIANWFETIENEGINLAAIAPTKLLTNQISKEELEKQFTKDLTSSDYKLSTSTGFGIMRWLNYTKKSNTRTCPERLIELCLYNLPFTNHAATETMWEAVSEDTFAANLPDSVMPIILSILHRALLDSQIKAGDDLDTFIGVSWTDRPILRARASKLAAKLWREFQHKNKPIPDALELWQTEAKKDVLPEVWKPWVKIGLT